MKKILSIVLLGVLALLVVCIAVVLSTNAIRTPSNDRAWSVDQARLPKITFTGDQVTIEHIRNFSYTSTSTYTPAYYTKTFDLNTLKSVDYIVEPFTGFGMAHTMLSFGFDTGEYVAVSVEIRKEIGEQFSPIRGLLASYEIMYVIADERDVLQLRAIHRKHPVYLYPVHADKDAIRSLFVSMLERAETLRTAPEFYNTLTNTCTTNIIAHVNMLAPNRAPWDLRVLFPAYSDTYAHELGLINTHVSKEALRATYDASSYITMYATDTNFSQKIREAMSHTP